MKKILISAIAALSLSTNVFAEDITLKVKTAGDSQLNTDSIPYQSKAAQKNMSLENDQLWRSIYSTIIKGANAVDKSLAENGQDVEMCSLHRIKSFNSDSYTFNGINENLPQIQDNPTQALNVNTFSILNKLNKDSALTSAYIPSVFAAELLMKKPYNPDTDLLPNAVDDVVYSQDIHNPNSNMRQNWTSLEIPVAASNIAKNIYASQGRTPALDASDLREATIRDLTTFAYIIATNPQLGLSVQDYLKSAMVIYSRNKFMCVYEAQNLMLTVF